MPVTHYNELGIYMPKIWEIGLYHTCNWVTLDLKCALLPCQAWIKLPLLPPYWLPIRSPPINTIPSPRMMLMNHTSSACPEP